MRVIHLRPGELPGVTFYFALLTAIVLVCHHHFNERGPARIIIIIDYCVIVSCA